MSLGRMQRRRRGGAVARATLAVRLALLSLASGCAATARPPAPPPGPVRLASGTVEVAYRLVMDPPPPRAFASAFVLAIELQSHQDRGLLLFDPAETRVLFGPAHEARVLDRPRALALLHRLVPVPAAAAPGHVAAAGPVREQVAARLLETTVFGSQAPLRGYLVVWTEGQPPPGSPARVEIVLRRLADHSPYRLVLRTGSGGAGAGRRQGGSPSAGAGRRPPRGLAAGARETAGEGRS